MANPDPRIRNLKIKTGVVKRIAKEKEMYAKEAEQFQAKVDKMKQEKADEHDIKKQEEVCEESRSMIPDARRRLKVAYEDLGNLVKDSEGELAETEEYKAAHAMLESVAPAVQD